MARTTAPNTMRIYCDHNASTPLRPEVLDAMLPYLRDEYGNASSAHAFGAHARCAVEDARAHVAALIGARPAEIVFTSGGTESNNLAIFGSTRASARHAIVTTPIEHSSVRAPLQLLEANGCRLRQTPLSANGEITAGDVETFLDATVGLVSVGWANNEIGTIQPVEEIGALCRARRTPLHVDAVQAVGKIPVHVRGIDLLSMSAHKLGGPHGIGALFVRTGIGLHPILVGGGQERGRRAGTENVAGIVGMGAACRLAAVEIGAVGEACVALREALWDGLRAAIPKIHRNSPDGDRCLPNTLNARFDGVRGEALVAALDLEGVAVSSGSACAAGAGEPSHVLLALGQSPETARDGVRFSFGRTNVEGDIARIVDATKRAVQRIRAVRGQSVDD